MEIKDSLNPTHSGPDSVPAKPTRFHVEIVVSQFSVKNGDVFELKWFFSVVLFLLAVRTRVQSHLNLRFRESKVLDLIWC